MIKILDNIFNRDGVIKNVIDSNRLEEINGENTLDFTAVLDSKLSGRINENTIYECDDDYFDTAFFKKQSNEDDTYTVEVQSEHISYRLNKPEYNVEFFTETGTPTYILGRILNGTGFTVGTVEYAADVTYSAQEAKSRRQLLMEFIAYLGGEVKFNKLEIGIFIHLGSTVVKPVLKDRNVKIVSKTVNKRILDKNGNPTVSYDCTPLYLPGDNYLLGDDIILIQKALGIQETLRVVSISSDPYDSMNVTFKFANYKNGIADSLYRIETAVVVKDKLYNGTRVGPEFGFENIRSDKKARSYFNATGAAWQVGDGTGVNWLDKLYIYIDPETSEAELIFNGKLSVDALEALRAEIDVVISSTIIVNNLMAKRGNIADLTVDRLDTSDKVRNYIADPQITDDVNYMRIFDQVIEWVNAQKKIAGTLPVLDRDGLPLYWLDDTHTGITNDVNEFPVTTFDYTERSKLKIYFDESDNNVPIIEMGVGTGNVLHPEYGRGFIMKDSGGSRDRYITSEGVTQDIYNCEEGIVQIGNTGPVGLRNIAISDDAPVSAQTNDLYIATNDYSRYDSTNITTSTTLLSNCSEVIICNSATPITLTLYAASTVPGGKVAIVKVKNIGAGLVTVDVVSSGTIDSLTSTTIAQWGYKQFGTRNTEWMVLGNG
jgi:hypothetical protein